MPKIKIKDLPEDMKVSEEELAKVRGGMRQYEPPAGVKGSYQPGPTRLTGPGEVGRQVTSKELFRR